MVNNRCSGFAACMLCALICLASNRSEAHGRAAPHNTCDTGPGSQNKFNGGVQTQFFQLNYCESQPRSGEMGDALSALKARMKTLCPRNDAMDLRNEFSAAYMEELKMVSNCTSRPMSLPYFCVLLFVSLHARSLRARDSPPLQKVQAIG